MCVGGGGGGPNASVLSVFNEILSSGDTFNNGCKNEMFHVSNLMTDFNLIRILFVKKINGMFKIVFYLNIVTSFMNGPLCKINSPGLMFLLRPTFEENFPPES